MNKNFVQVAAGVVELGCLLGLAGIALKRNNDCYRAECKYLNELLDHCRTQLEGISKDAKIKNLEKELEELKAKGEES